MNNRIGGPSGNIPVKNPESNNLETTPNHAFKGFMRKVGRFAGAVGKSVLPLVPGGAVIGAALEGLSTSEASNNLGTGAMSPYEMLNLQQKMLEEARMFTMLSNVMKIRHDSAMSAIRNIR